MLLGLSLMAALPGTAQVLARPGWAGSGVAPEAWWLRGVFYRIDPSRFQDSDGDGRGVLAGSGQRLDYLQSLGVDAVLLDGTLGAKDTDALGDLVREASRHQLRVLITANPQLVQGPHVDLVNAVRGWLGAGAAGVWAPKPASTSSADATYASTVSALRTVFRSFPGDRVLLTDPAPMSLSLAPRPVRLTRRIEADSFRAARGGQLVTSALFAVGRPDVFPLRASLNAAGAESTGAANGLLRFAQPPATGSPDAAAYAALLLGSRGAVILDFGEEIGLNLYPQNAASGALPIMQWTPSNHTQAPVEQAAGNSGQAPGETQFGAYHPYQPPPRGLAGSASAPVRVAPDLNVPETLPDADSLPGFTAGALTSPPENGARLNVTVEDRDPKSLLNAYRQLIAEHHGNPTLRNGSQYVLNRDTEGTLVWVRRAPAGSRTAATVVGVANLSDRPINLSLESDLEAEGMRAGALRTLFSSAPGATTGETTGRLTLPPHAAFLGEIYHSGAVSEPAPRVHRGGRRSGRRRVRR